MCVIREAQASVLKESIYQQGNRLLALQIQYDPSSHITGGSCGVVGKFSYCVIDIDSKKPIQWYRRTPVIWCEGICCPSRKTTFQDLPRNVNLNRKELTALLIVARRCKLYRGKIPYRTLWRKEFRALVREAKAVTNNSNFAIVCRRSELKQFKEYFTTISNHVASMCLQTEAKLSSPSRRPNNVKSPILTFSLHGKLSRPAPAVLT